MALMGIAGCGQQSTDLNLSGVDGFAVMKGEAYYLANGEIFRCKDMERGNWEKVELSGKVREIYDCEFGLLYLTEEGILNDSGIEDTESIPGNGAAEVYVLHSMAEESKNTPVKKIGSFKWDTANYLSEDGTVYIWQEEQWKPLTSTEKVVDVAGSFLLTETGKVLKWTSGEEMDSASDQPYRRIFSRDSSDCIGMTMDGTYTAWATDHFFKEPLDVHDFKDMIDIEVASSHYAIGLTNSGNIKYVSAEDAAFQFEPLLQWNNIIAITDYESIVYGLDQKGKVYVVNLVQNP